MEPSDGEIDLLVDYATNMLLEFNTVLCHLENPARFLRLVGDELEGKLRCGGKYHDVSLKAFKKASAGRGLSVHPVVRASEVRDAIKQILYEAWLREGKTRPYTVPSTRTVKRALKSEGLPLCDTPGKAPRR
jgi:hypothetical protein